MEAIRQSDKVTKVRALVAALDDAAATRAQISENMARRDLTFIEKALFARELIDQGFGTQTHVAEVLTVTKSAISMALAIVETVTPELARTIGPAPGIGRPRWDTLAKAIAESGSDPDHLLALARDTRARLELALATGEEVPVDPSVAAFEAVLNLVHRPALVAPTVSGKPKPRIRSLQVDGHALATLRRSAQGLRLDIDDAGFAHWLDSRAEGILAELHARWKSRDDS